MARTLTGWNDPDLIQLTGTEMFATVSEPEYSGRPGVDMFTIMSAMHQSLSADASARVTVNSTTGMSADWRFTAKPYTHQRPSGAPPG